MSTFEEFESVLKELTKRYDDQYRAGRLQELDEATLRLQYLNRFFEALGWDVSNMGGAPPSLADVVVESRTDVQGRKKRADYVFRINGIEKLVCEAKKAHEPLQKHAFQIQNYVYNLGLYLGVLTNFEHLELHVVGAQPNRERPFTPAFQYHFSDYVPQARRIWDLFSRENVANGSIDRYLQALPKTVSRRLKQGWLFKPERTRPVDNDFLEFLDDIRSRLAESLYKANPEFEWGENALNEAVQRIIDRILFIRICEDRDIDTLIPLESVRSDWRRGGNKKGQLYQSLIALFRRLAPLFNGGLFGKPGDPPHFSETLHVDDREIATFIDAISGEDSNYLFSTIPIEILGAVYERFLAKVIRVTGGGGIKVDYKPALRSDRGVYYTPRYVVNYIVERTVGSAIAGKSPSELALLRIVDPACGSGSFLLRAFERVCDRYVEWLLESPSRQKKRDQCYRDLGDNLRLTAKLKRKILIDSIYGVDLDPQAVEVAQLSLYLKVLEGETRTTLAEQRSLFPGETILPDLSRNVRRGNSLVGMDAYNIVSDVDALAHLHPFDWPSAYPTVMDAGGFDTVVGNPPYGARLGPQETEFYRSRYLTFHGVQDVYPLFIERGLELLRRGGTLAFIVPSAWLGGPDYRRFREFVLENQVDEIILLPFNVFGDAYVDTAIMQITKRKPNAGHGVQTFAYPNRAILEQINLAANDFQKVSQENWQESQDHKFVLDPNAIELLDNLRARCPTTFGDIAQIKRGVLFDRALLTDVKESSDQLPYFEGDVYRYRLNYEAPQWIAFGDGMRERPKELHWFVEDRLLLRRLVSRKRRLMSTLADNAFISNKNLYTILPRDGAASLPLLLAILNSRLYSYLYLKQVTQAVKDDFPQVTIRDVRSLPVFTVDPKNTEQKALARLAQAMIKLGTAAASTKSTHEKESYERQMEQLDDQIDDTVYSLFQLSAQEVETVKSFWE